MAVKARNVTVGLVQMTHSENPQENLAKVIKNIEDLASKGAQIICLSELFMSRYFCQVRDERFFDLAEPVPGPTTEALMKVAKAKGVVIIGSIFEKATAGAGKASIHNKHSTRKEKYFNAAVVIDADGKFLGKYRKMHIPDDPANGYDEAYYFDSGDLGFLVFETKFAKVAPMICFDQWFPEGARIAATKGAEMLFYPTAIGWPLANRPELNPAEHEAWQIMHRSHAIANNVFVVAVNRTGLEDDQNFWGTSFVSDPYGRVLGKAPTDQVMNLVVKCDLAKIEEMRKDWPFLTARVTKTQVAKTKVVKTKNS